MTEGNELPQPLHKTTEVEGDEGRVAEYAKRSQGGNLLTDLGRLI